MIPTPIDDTELLQARINDGGVLSLPVGSHNISHPLILPRTGYATALAVQVRGEGEQSTVLNLLPAFPPNRGAFEWATPTSDSPNNQILAQRITNLTIALPFGVDGVSAVKHVPFNKLDSVAACMNEWVQIDVERVTVKYTNAFNRVLFDFPNGFRFSTWDRVTGDGWQGLPSAPVKYDTTLLAVGSSYPGGPGFPGEDSIGIGFSNLSRLRATCNAGAWCQTFSGRMYGSSLADCFDNGARYGTSGVAFHFVNSSQVVLSNLACEGQGSCTLRLDNCDQIDATQITGGTPPMGAGPYQDSIIVTNSRGVRLRGHIGVPGAMPFSSMGIHALTVDVNCLDCVFEGFDVRATFDSAMPAPALRELLIDPAATVKVSGSAVQAYGNLRQQYQTANPKK